MASTSKKKSSKKTQLLDPQTSPSPSPPSPIGTAQKIDPVGLRALIQEHERVLQTTFQSIAKQEEYQVEYKTLTNTLKNLPNKLRHDALVPLGPLVMGKGKLIHTNEITCHLGDNWFVECSAKTAEKIAAHRIQKSKEMLNKFEKEKELITSWISEAKRQLTENESDGTVEITEVYDKEQDEQWRKKHRENVKKYYQQQATDKPEAESKEDQELWDRLDMLELEEELIEYENTKKLKSASATIATSKSETASDTAISTNTSSSTSTTPPTVDQRSILKVNEDVEVEKSVSEPTVKKADFQKRRVSFDTSKDIIHTYLPEPMSTTISSPVVEHEINEEPIVEAVKNYVIEKTFSPMKVHVPEMAIPSQASEASNAGDAEKPPERMSLFKQRKLMEENRKLN